jgi:hypothetical protein
MGKVPRLALLPVAMVDLTGEAMTVLKNFVDNAEAIIKVDNLTLSPDLGFSN